MRRRWLLTLAVILAFICWACVALLYAPSAHGQVPLGKAAFHFSNIPDSPFNDGSKRCAPWCDVRSGDLAQFVMTRGGQPFMTATVILSGPPNDFRVVVIANDSDLYGKVPVNAYMTRTTWNGGGALPAWAARINSNQTSAIPRAVTESIGVRVYDPSKDGPPSGGIASLAEQERIGEENIARVIGWDLSSPPSNVRAFAEARSLETASTLAIPNTLPYGLLTLPIDYQPPRYRMNVLVQTLPACSGNDAPGSCFPASSWSNPAVRSMLQIDDANMLTLRVWRIAPDGKTATPAGTVTLPAGPSQWRQFPVGPEFGFGDQIAVQVKPCGLLMLGSRIDTLSRDATTVYATQRPIEIPIR